MPNHSPRLTLRIPQRDLDQLQSDAETLGISVSEMVRKMIDADASGLRKKVQRKAIRSNLHAYVIRDVARAGNNLNRIAAALVALSYAKRVPNMALVVAELAALRTLLTDIRERL